MAGLRKDWMAHDGSCAFLALGAAVAAFVFLTARTPAQNRDEPQAVIKVQAPSVVVDVIVTDKKGRHVPGLKAEDFEVFEDNAPQRIVTFIPPIAFAEQPGEVSASAAARAPAPPAAEKEARDLAHIRFITLVMDLGDLQRGSTKRAVDAAREYVAKVVAPDDFVAVYWLDGSLHLAQPFTRDKAATERAIENLASLVSSGRLTSEQRIETEREIDDLEAKLNGPGAAAGPGAEHPDLTSREGPFIERQLATLRKFLWTQSTLQGRAVFVALRAIAEAYRDVPGRKNVVVFSEGFLHSPDVKPQMQAAIDAANRSNVAFYIVDAAGLVAGFGASSASMEATVNQQAYENALEDPGTILTTGIDKFDWAERIGADIVHDDLGQLAEATGGFYIKNQNELLPGLERVDSDLREFYTLVYQAANKVFDGRFRRIRVELAKSAPAGRSGFHVRYRLGYWAIPPGQEIYVTPAAAQLLAQVANGAVKTAFAPRVNAALLLAPDGRFALPVRVTMPAKSVKFERAEGRYRAGLTLVIAARDSTGRLVSVHQRFVSLDFDKRQWDEFEKKDLEINARLAAPDLIPLSVQAICQFSSGTSAIGEKAVAAGEPPETGLRLTGVLLTDHIEPVRGRAAQGEPASGPADPSDPLRGENFQLFLPAENRFAARDPSSGPAPYGAMAGKLTAYFGVVAALSKPSERPPAVRISYAVEFGGKTVLTLPPEEITQWPAARRGRLLILKQFDPAGLSPGRYSFWVTAEDVATHAVTSSAAEFTIG